MRLTSAEKLNNTVVMHLGSKAYTKQQCVDIFGTGNWRACRILDLVMKELGLKTLAQLYKANWADLWEAGAGYMTLLVATRVLHHADYNADEWLSRERGETYKAARQKATSDDQAPRYATTSASLH